jgi:hypothetical protein
MVQNELQNYRLKFEFHSHIHLLDEVVSAENKVQATVQTGAHHPVTDQFA